MGGLGIAPDVARRMTLVEAHFYLTGESRVKHACRAMNAVGPDGRMLTPEELCQKHADDMATRREYFTGSRSLELTEKELRGGDDGPRREETTEEIVGRGHFDTIIKPSRRSE